MTEPASPRVNPINTNVAEIFDFSVVASASKWTNHHSLALAATSRFREK